jgi:hypothetical protein
VRFNQPLRVFAWFSRSGVQREGADDARGVEHRPSDVGRGRLHTAIDAESNGKDALG